MGREAPARDKVPGPNPVTVTITPAGPKVDPESAYISLAKDQEIVWECKDNAGRDCRFTVTFIGASPFQGRVFYEGGKHSGRVRPDVKPDKSIHYPYAVEIVKDDKVVGRVDPDVIVGQ